MAGVRTGRPACLAFAIILSLVARVAGAECGPASAPNSQWKVESSGGAWWLETPCGDRFFSVGINGLDPGQLSAPAHRVRTRDTWVPLRPAADSWMKSTVAQIRGWGFNTAGGFSAPKLRLPNVPELDLGWRANILWSDPFDPSVRQRIIATAQDAAAPSKGNPYRIGYFSDNEIGWWNGALFVYYIRQPGTNHAKQKLVALIRAHYGDDWRRFVSDFVVPPEMSSFDELLRSSGATAQLRQGGKGIEVVRAWTGMVAANYYSLVNHSLRQEDPEALIFGDRLPIYYDPDAIRAEAPYVDAIATNYNVDSPDGWIAHYYFDGLRELSGNKPILISEWFYAAQENRSGNSNNEHLMTVKTQAERARGAAAAARRFAEIPAVVGIHWFQYFDEPGGGRDDGEDYDFGLVDRKSRPYEKLVEAIAAANRSLTEIHQGRVRAEASAREIEIPEAGIDARADSLAAWPKDEALVKGLAARAPEVPFGDVFLAWSREGLHVATISMDYYDPGLLAYEGAFPLGEAFRIDLGVDAGGGPRRFAMFVIPPRVFPKKRAPAMRIRVCRTDDRVCEAVPSAIATYFGSDQPRITAHATLPWAVLGGPPRDGRMRVQIAATAFFRSRWMSLSGDAPEEAMKDEASWRAARLEGYPLVSSSAKR
ncbi:MAG TPA: hypothetical protein VEF07_10915 [Candidatus Binataceae bacterium]|nr:hypothetical protein [Candidatus Binataceae bacterium]